MRIAYEREADVPEHRGDGNVGVLARERGQWVLWRPRFFAHTTIYRILELPGIELKAHAGKRIEIRGTCASVTDSQPAIHTVKPVAVRAIGE